MTFNTILFYYSRKGNTKALVNLFEGKCVIDNIENIRNYNLNNFSTVVFATSTYGRGIPPQEFIDVKDVLLSIKNKNIALFGSGNSHYEYYCGALDLLEDLLSRNNSVLFKYKYEGYPRESDFINIGRLMEEIS